MRKFMNNHYGQSRIFGKMARFAVDPNGGAEGDTAGDPEPVAGGGSGDTDNGDSTESIEALKAELAKAKAETLRFKNSNDKLLKEKGELTKKNRDMMSADQKEKEAQEEREKRFAEMERELRANKYSKRLVGIGMAETDADTFAAMLPELEDADAFFTSLSSFVQAREKSASDKAIQDLLRSRPDINAGNGDANKDDAAMTFAKAAVANLKGRNTVVNQDIIKNFL